MMFKRENLILPLVSHQAPSIPPDSVRAANKGENDVVIRVYDCMLTKWLTKAMQIKLHEAIIRVVIRD